MAVAIIEYEEIDAMKKISDDHNRLYKNICDHEGGLSWYCSFRAGVLVTRGLSRNNKPLRNSSSQSYKYLGPCQRQQQPRARCCICMALRDNDKGIIRQ